MEHGDHKAQPTEGTEQIDQVKRFDALIARLNALPERRFVMATCMTFGGFSEVMRRLPVLRIEHFANVLESSLKLEADMTGGPAGHPRRESGMTGQHPSDRPF